MAGLLETADSVGAADGGVNDADRVAELGEVRVGDALAFGCSEAVIRLCNFGENADVGTV